MSENIMYKNIADKMKNDEVKISSNTGEIIIGNKKCFCVDKDILDYIISLQRENKIKDTNWESLKYYLEKLYYKDYIEEAISNNIDKKIKELESKVNIKGYQKDIKALQRDYEDYKSRCEKADEYIKDIFKDEKWYENYEYNDLVSSLKDTLGILRGL